MMRERTQSNGEHGNMEQKIRMKGKRVEGEIVQVQGGHIIRPTSQKDRHCKVYTAKGPRDRRVRLSAHTAIQFYDVQDRLGYDRPSKAVDWLIEKAKDAIDELDGLPFHPNNTSVAKNSESNQSSCGTKANMESETSFDYRPEPDTEFMTRKKSFFPTSSAADSLMNYQNFPHDVMSRASFQSEDLGLSLHTLQDQNSRPSTNPGSSGSTFQDNYQGMDSWSTNGSVENRVGFLIDSNAMPQVQQAFFSQDTPFSHRELLHSNYSNFIQHNPQASVHQSSDSSSHFAFHFQVPARLHGDNEPEIQN